MATVNPMRPFDGAGELCRLKPIPFVVICGHIENLAIRQRLALWWGGVEFIAITQFFMFN